MHKNYKYCKVDGFVDHRFRNRCPWRSQGVTDLQDVTEFMFQRVYESFMGLLRGIRRVLGGRWLMNMVVLSWSFFKIIMLSTLIQYT